MGPDTIAILVVDSDVDDVEQTRQSFELAGLPAKLDVAASGEEALMRLRHLGSHVAAARPDVVLASFSLPGMGGIELLRQIRADAKAKRIPVIMFAGSASKEERDEAARLGADHILDKPEHESEFLGVVAAIKFFWMAKSPSAPPPGPAGSLRPARTADIDLMTLPLEPAEAYLLSLIDGTQGVAALSDLVGQSAKETRVMLKRLAELGAVQWRPIHASLMPPAAQATSAVASVAAAPAAVAIAPPRAPPLAGPYVPRSPFSLMPGKPLDARSAEVVPPILPNLPELSTIDLGSVPPVPSEPPKIDLEPIPSAQTPVVEPPTPPSAQPAQPAPSAKPTLDVGSRLVIDQTFELLGENNHYELLGVATDAPKADIRLAYYRLAKLFHPDSRYTWDLGPYERKMARIFQAVTDAYETLGKAKSRKAYDEYLGIVDRTAPIERALSMSGAKAAVARAPEATVADKPAAAPEEAPAQAVKVEPTAPPAPTPMRAPSASRPSPTTPTPSASPRKVEPIRAQGAVKALAQTLNQMSARTRGIDRAARLIADAKTAVQNGNLAGAASAMRIAAQWRPEDLELAREAEHLAQAALEANAAQYEQRAKYEEKCSMWKEAALSWSRLAKARPTESEPVRQAAAMLLKSEGDMREAMAYARRATELDPKCVESRIVLADVFVASGMMTSAKRQLEEALAIEPRHEIARAKLASLR